MEEARPLSTGEENAGGVVVTTPPATRGRVFVDLMSHLEHTMHAVAHVYPAVDHLAQHPGRPTASETERLRAALSAEASPGLSDAFVRWCDAERKFLEFAAELKAMHGRESDPTYQAELDRRIAALRAKREELLVAADVLRERIARELDG